jgi:serine protease AprX
MRKIYALLIIIFSFIHICNGAKVLLVLKSQASILPASNLKTRVAKSTYIYNTLYNHAQTTQVNIKAYLNSQFLPHRCYYLVNMIHTDLNAIQVDSMKRHPDVGSIIPDGNFTLPILERSINADRAIEWGLNMIQAPAVWAKGYKGQGIVIGGQDTGYDWDHPALINKYRGWNGTSSNHDYNWHDAIHIATGNPCGVNSPTPCDDNNHGTHTMGTMVGDDGAGNQIGVAPDAKWIGCRNMNKGDGTLSTYLECFEWFLAPYPVGGSAASGDPSKSPHVINNSWACPTLEGCNNSNFFVMEQAVNTLKAAGIVVVVSAGNEGNKGCNSVINPPAIFENSFSVGSTTNTDIISDFSSRGPVTIDGSNRIKPNVSAPGSGVRSCVVGTGYATYNGTSMAGPHVAGIVALLLNARPELDGEVEKIESIIEYTAVRKFPTTSCSDTPTQIPNNTYGWGRIDALAAINYVIENVVVEDANWYLPNHPNGLILTSQNGSRYNILIDNAGNITTQLNSTSFINSTKIDRGSLVFSDSTKSIVISTGTNLRKLKIINGALVGELVATPPLPPTVTHLGNIEIITPSKSLILKSSNGLLYSITVEDSGSLLVKNIPPID